MSDGRIEPSTWWGIEEASSSTAFTRSASSWPLASVPPDSRTIQSTSSSLRASTIPAARRMTSARSAGIRRAQSRCAACAAA